jgi:hypothetical protein
LRSPSHREELDHAGDASEMVINPFPSRRNV